MNHFHKSIKLNRSYYGWNQLWIYVCDLLWNTYSITIRFDVVFELWVVSVAYILAFIRKMIIIIILSFYFIQQSWNGNWIKKWCAFQWETFSKPNHPPPVTITIECKIYSFHQILNDLPFDQKGFFPLGIWTSLTMANVLTLSVPNTKYRCSMFGSQIEWHKFYLITYK